MRHRPMPGSHVLLTRGFYPRTDGHGSLGRVMLDHVVDVDIRFIHCSYGGTSILHHQEWRSTCSCSGAPGDWRGTLKAAREDGTRHVAAMERRP
jgi:hypothetical protein